MSITETRKPVENPRFSIQDLMEATGCDSYPELALMLGLEPANVRKIAQRGLDYWRADEFATRLGCYAGSVWSDWESVVVSHPMVNLESEPCADDSRSLGDSISAPADAPAYFGAFDWPANAPVRVGRQRWWNRKR